MGKTFKSAFAKSSLASLALVVGLGASASAAPLSWTGLKPYNGWEVYSSNTRAPMVAIDADGIVHLRGAISEPTGDSPFTFTLPVKFRPNKTVYVPIALFDGALGQLVIGSNGNAQIRIAGGNLDAAQNFTSLEGVTFSKY